MLPSIACAEASTRSTVASWNLQHSAPSAAQHGGGNGLQGGPQQVCRMHLPGHVAWQECMIFCQGRTNNKDARLPLCFDFWTDLCCRLACNPPAGCMQLAIHLA